MRRSLILAVVAAVALAAGAVAADRSLDPAPYAAVGGDYVGLRPTGVGLPQIGVGGTVGAGELASAVAKYHDSGAYQRDLEAVGAQALAYLDQRLADNAAGPKRTCKTRYRRAKGKLFRKVRRCKMIAREKITGKPAIVLDIDETSLSNYDSLAASNFSAGGLVAPAATGTGTVIAPTLALFNAAKANGVAVFFVTGRPSIAETPTESNLRAAGYDNWDGLMFKPGDLTTIEYKAGAREKLEAEGFDVLINVGDQESDLDGGFADKAFKLPNPFYFISD